MVDSKNLQRLNEFLIMVCVKEAVQLSISANPKDIRDQVTFPYNGRLMTCLGKNRGNSEVSHSEECQGRMVAAQKDAKKNFIRVLQSVSDPHTPIFDFELVKEDDRKKSIV